MSNNYVDLIYQFLKRKYPDTYDEYDVIIASHTKGVDGYCCEVIKTDDMGHWDRCGHGDTPNKALGEMYRILTGKQKKTKYNVGDFQ